MIDLYAQQAAHRAVARAKLRGELVVGDCAHGGECEGRIEAHHPDYTRPLDVLWLCRKHHREFHRKARATGRMLDANFAYAKDAS